MLWHKIQGAGGTLGVTVLPEYVGAVSASGASSLSFSGISGLQEGDLVICNMVDDDNSFDITSSGWTPIVTNGQFPGESSNNNIRNTNCYKYMGSTVDSDISIDKTIDSLCAIAFRNVDIPLTRGFETVVGGSSFFSSTSVTIVNDNAVHLIVPMIDDDSATISTTPSGYTIAAQAGRLGGSGAILYKMEVPSGTLSGIGGSWSSSDDLVTRGFELPPA